MVERLSGPVGGEDGRGQYPLRDVSKKKKKGGRYGRKMTWKRHKFIQSCVLVNGSAMATGVVSHVIVRRVLTPDPHSPTWSVQTRSFEVQMYYFSG